MKSTFNSTLRNHENSVQLFHPFEESAATHIYQLCRSCFKPPTYLGCLQRRHLSVEVDCRALEARGLVNEWRMCKISPYGEIPQTVGSPPGGVMANAFHWQSVRPGLATHVGSAKRTLPTISNEDETAIQCFHHFSMDGSAAHLKYNYSSKHTNAWICEVKIIHKITAQTVADLTKGVRGCTFIHVTVKADK